MVSEVDPSGNTLRQLDQDLVAPEFQYLVRPVAAWLASGGIAANGVKYARPSHAIAWGEQGCPLLPLDVREQQKGVRLPKELEQPFGDSVTVDKLDGNILARAGIEKLSGPPAAIFRDFLYSLLPQADQVAIPAGIPLAWFENLPLTGRARGAVRRAFVFEVGTDSFSSEPMLAAQFLGVRQVGIAALNELACVIETAVLEQPADNPGKEQDSVRSGHGTAGYTEHVNEAALRFIRGMSAFNTSMYEFASWAIAETDARTFGQAVAQLPSASAAANEIWSAVASYSLSDLAARPLHPYEVLDKWAEELDPRSRTIFLARISRTPQNRLTLEDLAAQFCVTRERIRQVEGKIRRALHSFLTTDAAVPFQWRASTIRQTLSVAGPTDSIEHLLNAPPGCHDYRDLLLEAAGPYDQNHGWFTLRSAQAEDPTDVIFNGVDEAGRIDDDLACSVLTKWGLDPSLHSDWLMRDGSVRLFNGQLVLWGTSIADRLAFALTDIGRPATIDEMVSHVGEDRSRYSINNALASDPRIVRVSRTHWGLASWGEVEYSGVAESMRSLLEDSGQPMSVDEMTHRMHRAFSVAETTTLAYCSAPMFVVEGQLLRLRTQDDESYLLDLGSIRRTPGIFWLGPMRLGRLFRVDWNMLRGSGTTLTHAAGAVLEVEVNANLSFTNGHGDHVQITFPETSLVGPSIGSVRRIAERLSAKEGDYLTLVLDRSDMTVTSSVTDLSNLSPGWQAISRLTGIAAPVDLEGLANALHCHANEVRSVLRARGDDEILDHLPESNSSTSLEEALAALEDQVESVRGDSL